MSTAIKWNASGSRELPILSGSKWQEIRWGLRCALAAHSVLLLFVLPGLFLISPWSTGTRGFFGWDAQQADLIGLALASLGGMVAYILLLVGQFRCLLSAPQGHGSKELLFTSLLSAILMAFFLPLAHFVGGAANYRLFTDGLSGLSQFSLTHVGSVLQVLGVTLGLLSILLFSGFLRTVACYLRDDGRSHSIVAFFWFVAFLVGGTIGIVMHADRIQRVQIWYALALGWVLCIVWHVLLIHSGIRALGDRFGKLIGDEEPAKPNTRSSGLIFLRDGSFFHRPQ